MPDIFGAIQFIAEKRISEALENGEFDNLPGAGKPLKIEDDSHIPPELRMAYKILKNANCLPEEIAQRKEISSLTELLDKCEDEKARIGAMTRLRLLLEKTHFGAARHAALEANDEYYHKALACLERASKSS